MASSSARFNRICRTGAGIKRKLIFHKHQGSNWILSRICVQDLAFWKLQIAKYGQKRKVWQLKVKKRGNCELLFLYNVKDFLCLSLQNLMPHLLPNSSNTKTKKALTLCWKSEQKFSFVTKPQLLNLQQTVAKTILIINISNSNNFNNFWVAIFTCQVTSIKFTKLNLI